MKALKGGVGVEVFDGLNPEEGGGDGSSLSSELEEIEEEEQRESYCGSEECGCWCKKGHWRRVTLVAVKGAGWFIMMVVGWGTGEAVLLFCRIRGNFPMIGLSDDS